MVHSNIKLLYDDISKILQRQQIIADTDLLATIKQTLDSQENNIRFFCKNAKNPKKEYFFKYQIQKSDQQTLKSRRQFNLINEINFYQTIQNHQFKKLIIPKYFHSSLKPRQWLIIEKLNLKKSQSLPKDIFFTQGQISVQYIPTIIDGLRDFHRQKFSSQKFYRQTMQDVINWLQFLSQSFNNSSTPFADIILRLFLKYQNLWDKNCRTLIHSDLVADTFAFSSTGKLILFDFEKVQISHPAFDFSSFVINPRHQQWNQQFFNQLTKIYPDQTFKILFFLSWILRLCHLLGNFQSGRLDYVYKPIIGSKKFPGVKSLYLKLWPQEILRLVNQINKLA